ncbi:hypothetical protein D3C76_1024120 [compost metagenome]
MKMHFENGVIWPVLQLRKLLWVTSGTHSIMSNWGRHLQSLVRSLMVVNFTPLIKSDLSFFQ